MSATRKSKRVAMRKKRKLESTNETLLRQMKDSIRKAQKRGLETEEQALQRKEIDRAYQSTKRAFKRVAFRYGRRNLSQNLGSNACTPKTSTIQWDTCNCTSPSCDIQLGMGLASFPGLHTELLSIAVRKAEGRLGRIYHMMRAAADVMFSLLTSGFVLFPSLFFPWIQFVLLFSLSCDSDCYWIDRG